MAGGLQERALAAIRAEQGAEARLNETLDPFTVSALQLHGTGRPEWHSQWVNIRNLETANNLVAIYKRNGRLILTLKDVRDFAFYVECNVFLSHGAWYVRWDALMSPDNPVNGRATRSADGRWYFATPRATHDDEVYITVDAQDGVEGDPDEHITINSIDILGFR